MDNYDELMHLGQTVEEAAASFNYLKHNLPWINEMTFSIIKPDLCFFFSSCTPLVLHWLSQLYVLRFKKNWEKCVALIGMKLNKPNDDIHLMSGGINCWEKSQKKKTEKLNESHTKNNSGLCFWHHSVCTKSPGDPVPGNSVSTKY